jgi:hypothetical protein
MDRRAAHLSPAAIGDEPDEAGKQATEDDGVREIAVRLDHDASLPRLTRLRSRAFDHGGDLRIDEGTPAPDFTLASDAEEMISLASLRGKPVVLYFYPRDDTPAHIEQ